MKIRITRDTIFKKSPVQSSVLPACEKVGISEGKEYEVASHIKKGTHYLIELKHPLQGKQEWYAFSGHVELVEDFVSSGDAFLDRIIKRQEKLGQYVFKNPGEVNIVYVEGISLKGVVNNDRMNEWNDVRLCYTFESNKPKLLGKWLATSEPGWKYTAKPLNRQGAFRIAIDEQYKAWVIGIHRNDHESLVQLWKPGKKLYNGLRVGEVRGHRDRNKDGFRTGDRVVVQTGIGINQHWGYDMAFVNGASAGCLVGKSRAGHRKFMSIVKSDVRYRQNKHYVFWTAVLDGSKLDD